MLRQLKFKRNIGKNGVSYVSYTQQSHNAYCAWSLLMCVATTPCLNFSGPESKKKKK